MANKTKLNQINNLKRSIDDVLNDSKEVKKQLVDYDAKLADVSMKIQLQQSTFMKRTDNLAENHR